MNEYMEKIIELSKELAMQEERSRILAARLDVANENLKEAKAHAAELEQSLLFRTEQHEAAVKEVCQVCAERDEAIKRAQNLEAKLKGWTDDHIRLSEAKSQLEEQHKDLFNRAVAQYECLEKIEGLVNKLAMDFPCAPHAVCVGIVRKEC